MTPCQRERRTRRDIEKLMVRGLSSRRYRNLRGHLRDCDTCLGTYERARWVEDTLLGGRPLSEPALDRIYQTVGPARKPRVMRAWPLVAALGAGMLALVALVPVVQTDSDLDLVARGGGQASEAGISLFWIDPERKRVERLGRQSQGIVLLPSDVMQLAYTNRSFSHGAVIGLDEAYRLQWYHPDEPGDGVRLRSDVRAEPFGRAWSIEGGQREIRLYGLFSDRPIDPAEVRRAAERVQRDGVSPRETKELPGLDVVQDSLLVVVQP